MVRPHGPTGALPIAPGPGLDGRSASQAAAMAGEMHGEEMVKLMGIWWYFDGILMVRWWWFDDYIL